MRSLLLLIPAIMSSLLLGAHFLRYWNLILVFFCLWLPLLLFVRRAWAARIVQTVMVFAALVWARLTWVLVEARQDEGEPWLRLVFILGAVAVLALAAAGLFETERLRRRYGLRTASWFKA